MRRKDREMPEEFGIEVIDKCNYGVAAMTEASGAPYAVALNFVRIDRALYFHCAVEGRKTEALKNNPQVCVFFVGSENPYKDKFTTAFESAVVRGTAAEVTEVEEKIAALRALCEKLTPDNMADFNSAIERSLGRTAVWRIDIAKITAKRKS